MSSLKFIMVAAASISGAVAIFGLFLIEAFGAAQLPVASAGKEELLYLTACFFFSLIFVILMLRRARHKFEASRISVQPLTYYFMATALAGFLWSFSFFSWCAEYHSSEFLHQSAGRYFRTAFLGSILGSILLGWLANFLSNAPSRKPRPTL